jgi:formylglycine-generating enzyme required for sulfatase activity
MHGNVEEWCQDNFGDYTKDSQIDPCSQQAGYNRCGEELRAIRGGSWRKMAAGWCRSASRSGEIPQAESDDRGLRMVIPIPGNN